MLACDDGIFLMEFLILWSISRATCFEIFTAQSKDICLNSNGKRQSKRIIEADLNFYLSGIKASMYQKKFNMQNKPNCDTISCL